MPDTSAQPQVPGSPPDAPLVIRAPGDIPADPDGKLTWWRPGWRDVAAQIGWGWLGLAPLLLLLLLLLATVVFPQLFVMVWVWGFKVWLFIVGLAITIAAQAIRTATHKRIDPFCIHCGYGLSGLPDHYRCPECGRPYSLELIEEYRRDPHWFVERWKMGKGRVPGSVGIDARRAAPGTKRGRSRDGT